tara:strand:- start:7273 stop:7842 length:570 start_codon:yes stop_codon:yes gene_type:complete
MINAELGHCKDVDQFYKSIREQQEEAHGADYCEQHDALMKYAKDCKTYAELGTHQGGTLACALLAGFKYIEGVDIDMHRYRKFLQPLAEKHAKSKKIVLKIREVDSTSMDSIGPQVDMLLIDSYHRAYHMQKELQMHGGRAKKYIIAHDTWSVSELHDCLEEWCFNNPGWSVLERGKTNVGYTVLKKDG